MSTRCQYNHVLHNTLESVSKKALIPSEASFLNQAVCVYSGKIYSVYSLYSFRKIMHTRMHISVSVGVGRERQIDRGGAQLHK